MELHSKIKTLVIDRGYNSLSDFSEKKEVSYYLLRRLASNKSNSIDKPFLIDVCKKLDCKIDDLLFLKE
jgi:DNA-binding Xre family transcriptional regulator